ncbi:B12-binding domain-containing radical SAM protein [Streptomyces kanamyceticus]|uniref:Radical SAM protein n=1 Tax=Streptomyces kanamyceticus TaxID=1967 RepID=A0A5J6GH60_STRKN|nr:cobalamin-dependent protein [Streptomyces kanamyceticus]QEU94819.1 radical SAM protein [Streptomyces kanamyceticus]
MRILLVKPPIRACMVEVGRHVPIGLAYLSAVLREQGHHTTVFDSLAFVEDNHIVGEADLTETERAKIRHHPRWRHVMHWGARWERIEEALREARPDVIGISCMFTPFYEAAYDVARLAKRIHPEATVLLGGQHGTVCYPHVLQLPEIDVVVLGEAESTIGPLITALGEGRRLDELPGIAFRCGAGHCACPDPGAPHIRPRAPFVADLDALPLPAADQLDFSRYDDATTLITSRGCPFSCTFCTVHATVGKEFRARSAQSVVEEIQRYVEGFGVRQFLIEDDNFTFDVERVHEICRAIMEQGLRVRLRLPNGITVVKLSEELVEAMVGAGFESLFFGLETTDVKRLRKLRKGFTSLAKVAAGAEIFRRHGLDVNGSLIVGLPGQNLAEIAQDSVNCALAGVRFYTNPFYPIPGSPDYRTCLSAGLIDPLTEPALFDQYNFAFGNGELSAQEMYWAWIVTQAVALWPRYVVEGGARREQGLVTLPEAARRLVDHSELLRATGRRPDVPALVKDFTVRGDELRIRTHPQGCFCATQRVIGEDQEDHDGVRVIRATDTCLYSGDVIAAALSAYTGSPYRAEQVAAVTAGDAEACVFTLHPTDAEPVVPILRTFLDRLDATRHEPDHLLVPSNA